MENLTCKNNDNEISLMGEVITILLGKGESDLDKYDNPNDFVNEKKFINNIKELKRQILHIFDIENKYEYKDLLIVYHKVDLDGHGIKLVNRFFGGEDIDTYGCDIRADEAYDKIKEALDNDKTVIIADLSFTNEYAEKVDTELDTSRIVLLDHHSSASYMNRYSWALVVPHDEENIYLSSGSLMFLIYCLSKYKTDKIPLYRDNILVQIIMNTALYDTWFWNSNFDYTREMVEKYFGSMPEDLNIFFLNSTRDSFVDYVLENLDINHNIFNQKDMMAIEFKKVERKKTIYRYYHNMRVVELNGEKMGFVFGDNEVSIVGNFILRANRELKYFAMIDLNSNRVMLRSRNDYNVSEIAIANVGGGGHPQAAGFTLDEKGDTKTNGREVLFALLGDYFNLPNIPESFSISSIKDVADFDEEQKIYKFK